MGSKLGTAPGAPSRVRYCTTKQKKCQLHALRPGIENVEKLIHLTVLPCTFQEPFKTRNTP